FYVLSQNFHCNIYYYLLLYSDQNNIVVVEITIRGKMIIYPCLLLHRYFANKLQPINKQKKKLSPSDNDLSLLARDIIANAGVGIYIVQKSKFVYVSELYKKLTGYTDTELLGTDSLNNI